ncbi:MAG TPA: thioredoxin-dependent thiol peroxidase [Phycisphaerae bacterium]|nr:thioredoxin-dependent thiol peroxidase [Phycisphaerae bacterium]
MPDAKIKVGNKAPALALPDQNGKKVALKDLAGRWVVLYFYPKDDTPGCTVEACEFTSALSAFEKLDATVLGVSPDSPASHLKFQTKHKLKITLLSDLDHKVLDKYGVWGVKKMYGKEHQGVIRSTVLIDPDGCVAYHWPNVKAAGHAEQVRQKLAELAGR